jgi:hypothetical protein
VATLVEAWFAGECEPLRDHLRSFVTGRMGDLRRQILEDSAFERQLGRILARLDDSPAVVGRCGPDCGCDTDPVPRLEQSVACTLGEVEMAARLVEWQRIINMATRAEHSPGRVCATFDPSPEVIAEVARLCAAEMACCPVFTFELAMAAGLVVLTIEGPVEALPSFDRP